MKAVSRLAFAALFGAVLLFSGCTTNDIKWLFSTPRTELDPPSSPNAILVVGYIDMSEMNAQFERMDIKRVQPNSETFENKFWRYIDHDSYTFYTEALTTGQYQFLGFNARQGANDNWFDISGDPHFLRTFSKPGIYYVGAYKIKVTKPKFMIGRMKFELIAVPGPGERDALLKILPAAKHPYWKAMIERRLRELPA